MSCPHTTREMWDCGCAWGCDLCAFNSRCVDCKILVKGGPTKPVNQCMGCQAGWTTRTTKFGGVVHEVPPPGYPGEIVGCTKDKYR